MIGEKHIFKKTWFDKKICLINDLLDFRGNLYTYNEFITINDVKTNFLEYHGVIAAVTHWLQRADIPFIFFLTPVTQNTNFSCQTDQE